MSSASIRLLSNTWSCSTLMAGMDAIDEAELLRLEAELEERRLYLSILVFPTLWSTLNVSWYSHNLLQPFLSLPPLPEPQPCSAPSRAFPRLPEPSWAYALLELSCALLCLPIFPWAAFHMHYSQGNSKNWLELSWIYTRISMVNDLYENIFTWAGMHDYTLDIGVQCYQECEGGDAGRAASRPSCDMPMEQRLGKLYILTVYIFIYVVWEQLASVCLSTCLYSGGIIVDILISSWFTALSNATLKPVSPNTITIFKVLPICFSRVSCPLSPQVPPSSQVRQFLTQLFTIWSHSSRPRYIPLFRPSLSSLSLFAPLLLPSLIPPPFFPIHLSFLSFLPFSLLHRPLPMCFCILYSPHVPQNFWRADLRQLQLPGMKLRQLSHSLTLENPSARKLRQLRQSLTLENLLLKL